MKIYLQNCKTLEFLRCDSTWSSNLAEALDFISIRRATAYGLTELKDAFQLLQVEINGFRSLLPAISQLPAVKLVTFPRPVRHARTLCAGREIYRQNRPLQHLRPAAPLPPALLLGLIKAA